MSQDDNIGQYTTSWKFASSKKNNFLNISQAVGQPKWLHPVDTRLCHSDTVSQTNGIKPCVSYLDTLSHHIYKILYDEVLYLKDTCFLTTHSVKLNTRYRNNKRINDNSKKLTVNMQSCNASSFTQLYTNQDSFSWFFILVIWLISLLFRGGVVFEWHWLLPALILTPKSKVIVMIFF